MANEFASRFLPSDGSATVRDLPVGTENRPGGGGLPSLGLGVGAVCPTGVTSSVLYLFRVPNAVALATGLTFEWCCADDPSNSAAGGKNTYWGVTVGPVTSGTTLYDETVLASSTEVLKATTMPATVGALKTDTVAVPIASMNSLAAGGWALARFRRLGGNVLDTNVNNRVFLSGLDVRNT